MIMQPAAPVTRVRNVRAGARHQEAMDRASPLILVVEDHAEFRNVLKNVLEAHGMNCVTADSVLGGLDLAWQDRPDMIIADWNLPDGTGGELISGVRAVPELQAIPVAVCTANLELREERTAMRAGADAFWPKSKLDVDLLGDQIRDLIQTKRAGADAARQHGQGDHDDQAKSHPS
jgi:CheY-like chemotaxis protein